MLCEKAITAGYFERLMIGRNNLEISLLQFADDTLLFCKPVVAQLTNIKRILKLFELMSGLKINFRKCNFFGFGRNIQEIEGWVQNHLCMVGHLPTTYLGLPLGARVNGKDLWAPVEEKLHKRVGSWKGNYLSMGGRVTMLKSVISSLPMYFMSLYKMPAGVRNKMEKSMRTFLWGGSEMRKKLHLVDWRTVTSPKELGGLGIINLEVQNSALLTKWIWRYGNERGSLWRQIISARTDSDPTRLLPAETTRRKSSFIWRNITQALNISSRFATLCAEMFSVSVGNGERILFWEEAWLDGLILKDAFPRIYALASNKTGCICDFGHWNNRCWTWDIQLRREVFDWERQQWNDLSSTIERAHLHQNSDDKLVWKGNSNGRFSASSFYKEFYKFTDLSNPIWRIIWSGYAPPPPKVEIFGWQVLRGRVAVKAEILRRGMINEAAALCTFCKAEVESVSHLFFHCPSSWSIWSCFLGEKNIKWCCPEEPYLVLLSWVNMVDGLQRKPWTMLFFAVTWSLWLFRNQMVFNGSTWDFLQLINSIRCRFAFWFQAKWPMCELSVNDILRGYDAIPNVRRDVTIRSLASWETPTQGWVKFNVDGSAKGKPGPAGIGGIMRDSDGEVLAIFPKAIGIEDSNAAEFMAVREAFLVFKMSRWNDCSLIVESDSKNAVIWANNPEEVPWRLRNLANHLNNLKHEARE